VGEAQQPGDGGDTGKPGKPLDDVAAQRLVHTKGETIEEHVTSAVWSTSPHLPSRSTPLQHLKGTRQERRQALSVVSIFHELLLPPPQPPRRYFAAPLLQESRKNERERQRE
jgi:hypothetical protein